MANVINKTTLQYLKSVNTIDYLNDSNWIINPDLSSLQTVPAKYWKVDGDNIVEMTEAEKSVIDEQEAVIANNLRIDKIWNEANDIAQAGFDHNSRAKALSWKIEADCPQWRLDRINAIDDWMDSIWSAYFIAKANGAETIGDISDCPYCFADLMVE